MTKYGYNEFRTEYTDKFGQTWKDGDKGFGEVTKLKRYLIQVEIIKSWLVREQNKKLYCYVKDKDETGRSIEEIEMLDYIKIKKIN